MSIYRITDGKLKALSQGKFNLEHHIQHLAEENLFTLFGLTFISGSLNKEFSVRVLEQDFYIDTLGFDENQNSFTIIEYKKDKSISVIDQGFAYLSAMLNHKADFVLELNERLEKNFKKQDIDWEQSRVIFVSPEFTNYQKNAINFKDLPIDLFEVHLYENDFVEFDPITPYRTAESIAKLSSDKTIQTVTKEVKVYEALDLLPNGSSDLKSLFLELRDRILALGDLIKEHPTKNYVAYRIHGSNIVYSSMKKNKIVMSVRITKPQNIPKGLRFEKDRVRGWDNTPPWKTEISNGKELDMVMTMIEQAYEEYKKRYEH